MYISSVGLALGDVHEVSEIAPGGTTELAPLIEEIVHFRESDLDIWKLAAAATEEALASAASDPDLVLYVSENDPDVTGSLSLLATRVGLRSVAHTALAGRDCGNLASALEIAQALITARRYRRILLVLADRALGRRRVMASGLSVFSDSAAACLLTGEPADGEATRLRLVDIATSTAVRPEEEAPSGQGILSTVRLASESVTTLLEKLDLTRGAFTHVVLPNYRPAAQKFVVAALRMPADRLLLGPVTELGHCFSADVLITLHQHRSVHSLVPGDRVLASVSGPHSWSTLAFECV